jgi:glycerol-3-phosphate dehydrogenase subunit C
MPLLEQGDIAAVAASAQKVATEFGRWIDEGWDIIALVPSCVLMLKFEWPLILPDDDAVQKLSRATFDLSEYVVDIARKEGMTPGMQKVEGGMSLHIACHARAQNMGQKGAEMLRLIPEADLQVIERCSGHGGSWGYKKENFAVALKVGKPVARNVAQGGKAWMASECPLAGLHIRQGVDKLGNGSKTPEMVSHPIQLLAKAYGITA